MGYYETIRRHIANLTTNPNEKVNMDDALTMSPETPVDEIGIVKMDEFSETALKDCIISNIHKQHQMCDADLKLRTWQKILEFLEQDFQNGPDTLKIYLQIFLHFTKMHIDEKVLDKSKYYDELLETFIHDALKPLTTHTTITEMSVEEASLLRRRLFSGPIIQAILENISALEMSSSVQSVNTEYICSKIMSAHIYKVSFFQPFDPLRGACVQDGIIICLRNVAGSPNTPKYFADLLTLAAHEFSHYIARLLVNDINFSSPWKCRIANEPRFDIGSQPHPLEIGRNTELILFDTIQPNWFLCLDEAASTFLKRVDSNHSSLPIIMKNEHDELGLRECHPSQFFGIDVKPEMILMC